MAEIERASIPEEPESGIGFLKSELQEFLDQADSMGTASPSEDTNWTQGVFNLHQSKLLDIYFGISVELIDHPELAKHFVIRNLRGGNYFLSWNEAGIRDFLAQEIQDKLPIVQEQDLNVLRSSIQYFLDSAAKAEGVIDLGTGRFKVVAHQNDSIVQNCLPLWSLQNIFPDLRQALFHSRPELTEDSLEAQKAWHTVEWNPEQLTLLYKQGHL